MMGAGAAGEVRTGYQHTSWTGKLSRTRQLVGGGFCGESLLDEILGAPLTLLCQCGRTDAVERHMVIRHNEAVRRCESARAAGAA